MIVKLHDERQIAIPSWMLEPADCSSIRDEDAPVISVQALIDLRELVDLQSAPMTESGDNPCSSNQGDRDEQGTLSTPTPTTKA